MAIYSTFFLCKPEELPGGFPGWQLPLAQPVRREVRDPFTGEVSVIETRDPQWHDGDDEEAARDHQVVEITGRYEDYLEGRLPPFVRTCPHWATKGMTQIELDPLCKAAAVESSLECAIYSPPSVGAIVQQLPTALLMDLGSVDQGQLANRWAAAMSSPEHTHSVSGVKLCDGWTTSEALDMLRPIAALARRATAGQSLYLLVEA
jgi:hypothetical protein